MTKILVTGGTSFVGHWLRAMKPDGVTVVNIGRQAYEDELWQFLGWDAIIHCAPVAPTEVLAYALRQNIRVLYVSSGIVYHPENDIQYRRDKLAYEAECRNSGADVVIARLFTFSGAKLDDNKAITTFYKQAKANLPIIITGDGSTTRSYMRGEDMARWMWLILRNGVNKEAYDVGSDMPITMLQLARYVVRKTGSKSEIIIGGGCDPMPKYLPVDTAKTKLLLLTK